MSNTRSVAQLKSCLTHAQCCTFKIMSTHAQCCTFKIMSNTRVKQLQFYFDNMLKLFETRESQRNRIIT